MNWKFWSVIKEQTLEIESLRKDVEYQKELVKRRTKNIIQNEELVDKWNIRFDKLNKEFDSVKMEFNNLKEVCAGQQTYIKSLEMARKKLSDKLYNTKILNKYKSRIESAVISKNSILNFISEISYETINKFESVKDFLLDCANEKLGE